MSSKHASRMNARTELLEALRSKEDLAALMNSSFTKEFLPEFAALKMDIPKGYVHKDNFRHSLDVVERSRSLGGDTLDLLAGLLHDIGKPSTRAFGEKGVVSFTHHDVVGANLIKNRLNALGFAEEEVLLTEELTRLHLRTFGYQEGSWTDSGLRRFLVDTDHVRARLMRLIRADVTTKHAPKLKRAMERMDNLEVELLHVQSKDEEAALRPALSGDVIMEMFGLGPGREVGQILRELLRIRKEGILLDKEEAEVVAREVYEKLLLHK